MTCTTILTVEPVHTGPTAGICGGAVLAAPGVADNGGPHECPPQPFWTGVAMAPCLRPFSRRWTHSPYRFMQVPTNADFRSISDVGTVLHERTLKGRSLWYGRKQEPIPDPPPFASKFPARPYGFDADADRFGIGSY